MTNMDDTRPSPLADEIAAATGNPALEARASALQEEIANAGAAVSEPPHPGTKGDGDWLGVAPLPETLTPYECSLRAAAALKRAAELVPHTLDGALESRAGLMLGVSEGWRHLAATMSGGEEHRRPIGPPKPVDDDSKGR